MKDMEEKRRSVRMDLDVRITLREIDSEDNPGKDYEVKIINLSKGGMAFKCQDKLVLKGFYDAQIKIWTKEKIHAVIQIVRKMDDDVYGGKFVGMSATDQFKIEVYELFNYQDEEKEEKVEK